MSNGRMKGYLTIILYVFAAHTPLILAVLDGHVDVVGILLEAGAVE